MGGRNNIKLGFIATASIQLNNNYKASNAFNCYYTGRRGTGGEWVSNNEKRERDQHAKNLQMVAGNVHRWRKFLDAV